MVPVFDSWAAAAQLPVTQPLKNIGEPGDGPVIGVDAAYYLEELRYPSKEPLVAALGGYPMALEAMIARGVKDIESCGCKLYFFFNGLDSGSDDSPFAASTHAASVISRAFSVYEMGNASGAIEHFKHSGFPDITWLCSALKVVLHRQEIPFVVAPFNAHAQMMHHLKEGAIDAIYGPSDLFLSGATRFITKLAPFYEAQGGKDDEKPRKKYEFNPDQSTFTWLELEPCLKMLGDISHDTFISALFLAGCSLLEAFPPLSDPLNYQQPFTFRNVIDLLLSSNGNVIRLCDQYVHDARLAKTGWADRYMRASQAVRHMIVLFHHNLVKPRTYKDEERSKRAPSDLHELIGLALPEELQYYLYRGMIGPRVLNWLMSGKIRIFAPLSGGDSDRHRKLVTEDLKPRRKEALAVLAFSINRYFQQKEVTTSFWLGPEFDERFNVKDLSSPTRLLSSWRVSDDLLSTRQAVLQINKKNCSPGGLYFAVRALADKDFCFQTIRSKPSNYDPLLSAEEIVCNVLWRFLQQRGYVDEKHELTDWGNLLLKILDKLDSTREQAEAALLAVELLRLGLLTADPLFAKDYGGAAVHGSETDRKNCLLVARLACTGKMLHPAKGYSGPLSRHLLAYHSLVTEVRLSLRDLMEMILAVMFLEGDVERIREDLLEIAAMLPYQEHYSAGLGVLTKIYLDELATLDQLSDKTEQQRTMGRAEGWLVHTDVSGSFKLACELWDAVYEGVKNSSSGLLSEEDRRNWGGVDAWLSPRRLL